MSEGVVIALISVIPTTLAVVFGFAASRRNARDSIARPLIHAIASVEARMTHLTGQTGVRFDAVENGLREVIERQAEIRERLARLEGRRLGAEERLWVPPGEAP